ncbi:MAG: response regulator [Balneolaceae bacterium]|nr:response regulator [Balneolaceae bacterium]
MNEKILITDDEKAMHLVLDHMLKDRFDILHAESAQEAIDILSNERVDLVLCDIHMPGMSGIQFLESLQLDTEHQNIPFLIITGQPSTEKEEKALNLGAADFIDKALIGQDREKVIDRISMKIFERRSLQRTR